MPLVTGSDAGNMLVFHGPTVHRELQLWVEAGIPPAVALQAATLNAARLLRAAQRIGSSPRATTPICSSSTAIRPETSPQPSGFRWSC